MMPDTIDWRERASCLGHAPLWDATIDDGGRHHGEDFQARQKRYALAVSICERCPVFLPCGAAAEVGRDEGVRGGVLLPPLETVRRSDGEVVRVGGACGTPYGSRAHRARGEDVCDSCVDARRTYDRAYQRKRRSAA